MFEARNQTKYFYILLLKKRFRIQPDIRNWQILWHNETIKHLFVVA